MASIVELAILSEAAYSLDTSVPVPGSSESWTLAAQWNGQYFQAGLYKKGAGAAVLSYAGTDSLSDVLIDDLMILLSNAGPAPLTPQMLMALKVAEEAAQSGMKFYVTGHSLGGGLAIIVAAYQGRPAVTFNAPGVKNNCIGGALLENIHFGEAASRIGKCTTGGQVLNIRVEGDPVSSRLTTAVSGHKRQAYSPPPGAGYGAAAGHAGRSGLNTAQAAGWTGVTLAAATGEGISAASSYAAQAAGAVAGGGANLARAGSSAFQTGDSAFTDAAQRLDQTAQGYRSEGGISGHMAATALSAAGMINQGAAALSRGAGAAFHGAGSVLSAAKGAANTGAGIADRAAKNYNALGKASAVAATGSFRSAASELGKGFSSIMALHGIKTCVQVVKGVPENFQDLQWI